MNMARLPTYQNDDISHTLSPISTCKNMNR